MIKETKLRALRNQTERLDKRLARLRRTSYRLSWLRLGIFVVGVLVSTLAFYLAGAWPLWIGLALTALPFGVAVYHHRRIERGIARHRVWLQIKAAHIARMRLNWDGIPSTFGYRPQPDHPFEADLDLVGERSLYRLIDTAVSYEGSQRIASWLTAPIPERGEIIRRQEIVRELIPLRLFRDKLALNAIVAMGTRKTWEANQLKDWLERHTPGKSQLPWLPLLGALAGLNAALFVANTLGLTPPLWQITFGLYLGLIFITSRTASAVSKEAVALDAALRQLNAVFGHLEAFSYPNAPHLKSLCAPFLEAARRPSRHLSRVTRVVAAMGLRENPILWFILNALVPWDAFFTYLLNRLKADLAHHAPAWMDVWFELEALSSLANLAYLNPTYTFPSFVADEHPAPFVLHAESLGHPLIPEDERICNDFTLTELGEIAIVTGSNMAGKSVFLKTVGANLALAYAGGPVNAQKLQTALLRPFTSIQVTDSVTDGISYFYAEVKRLKALLSELERDHPLPLLFLIDEIFRGTNNRERLIGSRAFVQMLTQKRGAGIIATHDLELTKLADQIPTIKNYHFRDAVADGRMTFDYTLRPGPCPTTNALKIMEMEGLLADTDETERNEEQ